MGLTGKDHKLWKNGGDDSSFWGNFTHSEKRAREKVHSTTISGEQHIRCIKMWICRSGRDGKCCEEQGQPAKAQRRQKETPCGGNNVVLVELAANRNYIQGLSIETKPGNRPFLQGHNEQVKLIIKIFLFFAFFPTYLDSLLFRKLQLLHLGY